VNTAPEERVTMTEPFGRGKIDVMRVFGDGEPVVVRKRGARLIGA